MTSVASIRDIVASLAEEPLRHVVLLKQLAAYPEHVTVSRVTGPEGAATLVALDTSVSPYDRATYPRAAVVAFVSSDHPTLTAALMPRVPRDVGIVFKLSNEADLAPIASRFAVARRTSFVSFTSPAPIVPSSDVRVTTAPGDAAFRLFDVQGHDRAWLNALLQDGKAFVCMLEHDDALLSACFVFENYGPVWEIGGVLTVPFHRRMGLAARVVRTAVAELGRRGLAPRYSVEERNQGSIGLARSIGLVPFLTVVHYEHERA